MHYRLLPLHESPLLSQFLFDLYELKTEEFGEVYNAVPNGLIGLSVKTGGVSETYRNNNWERDPAIGIFGLIQKPHLFRTSPFYREIDIGFKPGFWQMLVSESMSHFTGGCHTDAYSIFARPDLDRLYDLLSMAETDAQIISAVEQIFKKYLDLKKLDTRLILASELISNNKVARVEALAQYLNISSATLRNLFREKIGVSPKDLIKLTRIRAALQHRFTSEETLTSLAYKLGYFDQSHFIHDFKSILGMSPQTYFRDEGLVFDFYNYGRWRGDSFGLIKN